MYSTGRPIDMAVITADGCLWQKSANARAYLRAFIVQSERPYFI